ncbi:orotidine-5'-phosphate decarboxylase [Candidatus Gottesmanbacteria bacterium]|nr:orotidine-5'-phosphate decarboxylase [Candidatus Gottesmanbacteria bacterium]
MNFQQKLDVIVGKNNSLVCVGLDSDISKIPEHKRSEINPQFTFNKAIVDVTHDLVCAYKPNTAFYESRGSEGIQELKMTCDYLHEKYAEIPIILDAKRADIGSTNEGYVDFAFDWLGVDAITLHPYLGKEALKPFLDRKDKGCIILCRTSNSGAGEFQDLLVDEEPLYQRVAKKVVNEWNANNNCMLVVGATYPEELAAVRKIAGDMTFLVPGIGAQSGDVEKTVKAGLNSKKSGMIINSSRGIIFASSGDDFAKKSKEETKKLKNATNKYRKETGYVK